MERVTEPHASPIVEYVWSGRAQRLHPEPQGGGDWVEVAEHGAHRSTLARHRGKGLGDAGEGGLHWLALD